MREAIERGASATTYVAGGGTAIFGGMSANDLALWIGVFVTIATFFVNLWFKWDRRQFDRRMAKTDRRRNPRIPQDCPGLTNCPHRSDEE